MLTDKEIQTLINAREVLTKLKDVTAGSKEANVFLDMVLDDIYEGWIEHINEE